MLKQAENRDSLNNLSRLQGTRSLVNFAPAN